MQRLRDLDDFAVVTDPGRVLEGRPPLLAIPAQPLIGADTIGKPLRALRLAFCCIGREQAGRHRGGREEPAAESRLCLGPELFVFALELV